METLELIEKALENTKFRAGIKGIYKIDDFIHYTAVFDGTWLKIIACPDSILKYGFLKGITIDVINIVRSEFKMGFKDEYISDKEIKEELTKRLENEPTYMIPKKEIKDVRMVHREGQLKNLEIEIESGVIISIYGIKCTNLEKSEKTLNKFNP